MYIGEGRLKFQVDLSCIFCRNFPHRLWKQLFDENVLEAHYTKLKNEYQYTQIFETICRINIKLLENIIKFLCIGYISEKSSIFRNSQVVILAP